jgi:hypothetical protein
LSDTAFADTDAAAFEPLAQFRLGQVRLLLQPVAQTFPLHFREPTERALMRLREPLFPTGAYLLRPDFLALWQAHAELVC